MNVIDYSLLVQSALPSCGRSAQGAPFAQLALRRAGDLTHARRPQKARTAASTGCCMPSGSGRICAGWSFLRAVAAKNRRAAAKYARKMLTLARDFHRCCKNRADAGEEKSRYSAFISRLRPGKRFSGIYTHPEGDLALKRENFADLRKSFLAGRRSSQNLALVCAGFSDAEQAFALVFARRCCAFAQGAWWDDDLAQMSRV